MSDPPAPLTPQGPRYKVEVGDAVGRDPDKHNDLFFAAVETTRMPMIVTDPRQPDNPIVFANRAFLGMTGYTPDELIGRNCRFLQGPETDPDSVMELRKAVEQQREIALELINYRKNGSSFWNALFVSPVYDNTGELVYFFGSQLDVSRRRDAEEALRQSQKMEALGQLTGGIAHDFNNLLQVILGYADSLRLQLGTGATPRSVRALDNIGEAANRAATLTQQLLAFSRKQRLQGRAVNLNSVIGGMSDLVQRTLGETIHIETEFADDLRNCRLDPVQTELALLNILINARDAMANGGSVTIRTYNQSAPSHHTGGYPGTPSLAAGHYAAVSITDTGTGIDAETLKRVMEPFFTTKEVGRGTGLGLAMVYGFVKQSGGSVHIDSEVGQGTTVHLVFPALDADEKVHSPAPTRRVMDRTGTETILVVEDRPDVMELARTILEDFGYTVLTAGNGPEALDVLDQQQRIDMLFSDLVMPGGMNGVMLAREARSRQPRLKVLLTTGYAEASLERTDIGGSEFEVIDKPYRRLDLARRVRLVLDGPTGVG